MSIRVEALRQRLDAVGAVTGASIGTTAQDAYRDAVRTLKDAQKKLTTDTEGKAADHVLLSDRLAIQVAQAAVAQAASALAFENDAIWPSSSSGSTSAGTAGGSSAPVVDGAAVGSTPGRSTDAAHRSDRADRAERADRVERADQADQAGRPGPTAPRPGGIDLYT
ncbi:hypothetical protein [Nocardioides sp.]|uniref:hypothetical protein n=1 Tax=Nocardioides sp. TaxID=35761 RepID=UPI0025F1B803|nr:hypothetical protein [Nocardioides sp.]